MLWKHCTDVKVNVSSQLCQNVFVAKPQILKVSLETRSQMAVYSKIGNYLITIRMFLSESNVNNILINLPVRMLWEWTWSYHDW